MAESTAEKFWNAHPDAGKQAQWTGNRIIADGVYRRMTGGLGKFWLTWLLQDHFAGKRFKRMLSPGCGMGDHERIAATQGTIDHIDAFDFSQSALQAGAAKAKERDLSISFYQDDLNTFTLPKDVTYDLVICSGSVHHVKELERFFETICAAMDGGGHFVINEYVGACYNAYPPKQTALINRLLACIPKELKVAEQFVPPTIQEAIARDPSESVRSALILPLMEQYFDVELVRDYNGGILHPLYPLLNHQRLAEPGPEGIAALRLLLEFEAILAEEGVLPTDFTLRICRPKQTSRISAAGAQLQGLGASLLRWAKK